MHKNVTGLDFQNTVYIFKYDHSWTRWITGLTELLVFYILSHTTMTWKYTIKKVWMNTL